MYDKQKIDLLKKVLEKYPISQTSTMIMSSGTHVQYKSPS